MEMDIIQKLSSCCITGLVKVQTLIKPDEKFSQRELHISPSKAALYRTTESVTCQGGHVYMRQSLLKGLLHGSETGTVLVYELQNLCK